MKISCRFPARAAALALAASLAMPASPSRAQMAVFDTSNYRQNLIQAARELRQINQQIDSLQNEAVMIRGMQKNLERIDFPQLDRMTANLREVDRLMGQAQGIRFSVGALDRDFARMFPGAGGAAPGHDRMLADARARLDSAMAGFRHSMAVQSQLVGSIREDGAMLAEIARQSQRSVGALQAQQATNQLLALSAKQQLQLQHLMASEFRSQAVERARQAQAEMDARAATRRFLGSGRAYTRR